MTRFIKRWEGQIDHMKTLEGKKALTPRSADPRLYGWDDGKIYYRDDAGREHCVTDMPELLGESLRASVITGQELDQQHRIK
jgi:hypothetical protein